MFKLIKEIKSRKGVVHFRRYLILVTPWFDVYLHNIYQADKDEHLHNHPWDFFGIILWGGYVEETERGPRKRGPLSIGYGGEDYFHKIKEISCATTSLFIVSKKTRPWGYKTENGFTEHQEYRKMLNERRRNG